MKTVARLLLVCLLASSCRPATSPPPERPPSPAGIQRAYPQAHLPAPETPGPLPSAPSDLKPTPANGRIAGRPFAVQAVLLWQGGGPTFLSFSSTVPVTSGQFDPRARQQTDTRLLVFLDPARIKIGHWIIHAGTAAQDPTCPVLRVALQLPRPGAAGIPNRPQPGLRAEVVDTGWHLVLRIDQVVRRKARDGSETLNIVGALACRFENPRSWLDGVFVARDTLRSDEVAPDQPDVPAPTPPVPPSPLPSGQ